MNKFFSFLILAILFIGSVNLWAGDFYYSFSEDVATRLLFAKPVNHTDYLISPYQKLSFAVDGNANIIVADNTYEVSAEGILKLSRFHPGDGKELDALSINIGTEAYRSDATYIGNDDAGNMWLVNIGFSDGWSEEYNGANLWVYGSNVDVLLAHVDSETGVVVNKCRFNMSLNKSASGCYTGISLPSVLGSLEEGSFKLMLPYYWISNNINKGNYGLNGYEGDFDDMRCIIDNENFNVSKENAIFTDNYAMENTFSTYFFEANGSIYCVADFLESHPTVYECTYLDKISAMTLYNSTYQTYEVSGKGFNVHDYNGQKIAVYGLRSHDSYMENGSHDVCMKYITESDLLNGSYPFELDYDLIAKPFADEKVVVSRSSGDNSRDYLQSKVVKLDNGADCLYTLSSNGLKGYELMTAGKTPTGMIEAACDVDSTEMTIYDLSGRIVADDLSTLTPGVYLVRKGGGVIKYVVK